MSAGIGEREPFRLLSGKRPIVRLMVWITQVVLVAYLATDIRAMILLRRIDDGDFASYQTFVSADALTAEIFGWLGVCALGAIAAFVAWFYAAYRNLDAVGEKQRFHSGWAAWAWWIPVFNLWRPKQMTNDLAAAARRRHPDTPLEPAMLNAWWGLVVISISVWIASFVFWERAETLDEMVSALFIDAISVAIWMGAGVMTLWLVREIGVAQAPEPYRPVDDPQVEGQGVPPVLPSIGPDMLTADD